MEGLKNKAKFSALGCGAWVLASFLRKKKNKLNVDGIISSSDPDAKVKLKDVNGSFYLEMMLLVNKNIKQNGDWLWMKDSLNGECLMASEVESISKRLSVVFSNLGLKKGDSIHILAGNHHYALLSLFAAWYLGASASAGDIALDSDTIASQLDDLKKAKIVICTPNLFSNVFEAVQKSKHASNYGSQIVCLGEAEGSSNLFDLLKDVSDKNAGEVVKIDEPDKEKMMVFWTSGTSGQPKGICWTHQGLWDYFALQLSTKFPTHTIVSTQTFFHIGGFWNTLAALLIGHTFCHLAGEGATVTKVLEVTKEVKPACIILGSHQFVQMSGIDFESTGLKKNDLGSILWITPVGASVPPITSRNIKKLFPNMATSINVYGSSEVGPVSIGTSHEHLGSNYCRVQIKLLDIDTGKLCSPGETGEICVRSPYHMSEYLERPESTKECFLEDGFIRTGDLGVCDKEGRVSYVDRMKSVIKYQNNHVSAIEIENLLQEHPDVYACLVYGKEDPEVQELISAIVVLKENRSVDTEDLRNFVNGQVKIDYKKIRGDITIRDKIATNSNGKILRSKAAIEQYRLEIVTSELNKMKTTVTSEQLE